MEELKERTPFNVGDEVEFLMLNSHTFSGTIDCICDDWVRFKDGREVRPAYIISVIVKKMADIAKEAEEFLAKEKCPEELKRNDQRKKKG